jgi:AraC-like DNA-binding protein
MPRFHIRALAFNHPRLRSLADYVHAHPSKHLSLQAAARMANFSPKYLSEFFHERVGVAFSQWQCGVRIVNARRLLLLTEMPVEAVGRAVSYENPDTFARAFKRYEGVCPRHFKRVIRGCPELRPILESSHWPAETIFRVDAMRFENPQLVLLLLRLAARLQIAENSEDRAES